MNLITTEFIKLYRKKSTRILWILYGISYILITLFYLGGEIMFNVNLFNSNQFIGASLKNLMGFMLPLMALYLASSTISLDYSKGTIKNMYLLPLKKEAIYMSKIISVQLFIGVLLSAQFVLSAIIAMIQEGFQLSGIGAYFLNYVGAFFVLLLINLFGTAMTLWIKNTGLVIIIAYGSYIVAGIVTLYLPVLKAVSFRHIISSYSEFFKNGSVSLLLSIVAYYIIVFIVGLLLFEKKDENICQFD
jgi:ABC-2 type transport system permease protein